MIQKHGIEVYTTIKKLFVMRFPLSKVKTNNDKKYFFFCHYLLLVMMMVMMMMRTRFVIGSFRIPTVVRMMFNYVGLSVNFGSHVHGENGSLLL